MMTERMMKLVADGLCSTEEARKFLGISRSKLYELMEAGELEYAKLGRNRKIPWAAVKALAARSLVGAE
jgi:excisionase family DNA binding protein